MREVVAPLRERIAELERALTNTRGGHEVSRSQMEQTVSPVAHIQRP
jgi:hypothetical protein